MRNTKIKSYTENLKVYLICSDKEAPEGKNMLGCLQFRHCSHLGSAGISP